LPSTRLPPGGGCAVGALVCRTRGSGRSKGGRVEGARGRRPEDVAVPPRRYASAFAPAAGCLPSGRRPEGRWLSGCRWLQVPGGSVAVVRGSRRSLSPWVGARWVRRAVRGARRRPSSWSGPVDPSAGGLSPVGPLPRFGAPEGAFPRGSGPGGSVALARGPGGSCCRGAGARGPSRGSGRPKASVPVVGARWVRRAVRGARRHPSPWSGPVEPSAAVWSRWVHRAVRGARRRPSPWSGPGGSVAAGRGSRGTLVPWQG
jgi:hypothetical protein